MTTGSKIAAPAAMAAHGSSPRSLRR
uniref:Uncharacterized protein n=1 Tax=Arundo donax TaxID=35708 RepID=A0A0A8Z6T2_ARUDO